MEKEKGIKEVSKNALDENDDFYISKRCVEEEINILRKRKVKKDIFLWKIDMKKRKIFLLEKRS